MIWGCRFVAKFILEKHGLTTGLQRCGEDRIIVITAKINSFEHGRNCDQLSG